MTFGQQLQAIARLCYFNGLLPGWRSPFLIAAIFLTPFTFLFFLRVIDPSGFSVGVVGGVLFTVLFSGEGMLNDCAYLRLERRLQYVYVASPVRPLTYVLGTALSELVFTLPALVLFLLILELVAPLTLGGALLLAVVLLLLWLFATTLGFLISTLFQRMREIWPVGTFTFSLLGVLPPLFYSLEAIPPELRWVAFLAPPTYAAQLADLATGVASAPVAPAFLGSPWFDLVALVGLTAAFALAATFLGRWREP